MGIMGAREKAYWLARVNPYKPPYLRDAFKEGARAFWTGRVPEYLGNSREVAAFWRGYKAAEEEDRA
jgi:hypothetical protein